MTTLADLIEEARAILTTSQPDAMNILDNNVSSGGQSNVNVFYDLKGITAGSRIAIGIEDMHVWEIDQQAKSVSVQRAMNGSAEGSYVVGDIVYVKPKFSGWDITRAMNAELLSLRAQGLYATDTLELTYQASENSYDLTGVTDIDDILDVSYDEPGSTKQWPKLKSFKLRRNAETSDFPSGFAVTLFEGAYPGRQLRVTYSTGFTPFSALTDDAQDDVLFPVSANDILPLGAALRLSGYRELARNFTESKTDSRRASEVPPRAVLGSMQPYAIQYQRRVQEEAKNLIKDHPYRKRIPA